MAEKASELELFGQAARLAWQKRWWIFLIQVATTLIAVVLLQVLPSKYMSTTIVRVEKDKVINPLTEGLAVSTEMEERLRTLEKEILSPDYMEKIITRLKLEPPGADRLAHRALVDKMLDSTELAIDRRNIDIFQISFVGRDPSLVRDVTNLLPGIFIEESLAYKENEAGSAFEFLQDQLEIYRQKLEQSEEALRKFEEKHVDELPSNRNTHLARLEFLRNSLNELRNSISETKIQREIILKRLPERTASEPTPSAPPREAHNTLYEKLWEREERLQALLRQYSENYPDVGIVRAEIEDIKRQIAENPPPPVEDAVVAGAGQEQEQMLIAQLQQLDVELSTMMQREQQFESEIVRFEKKVQTIPHVEQQLTRLMRDNDVNSNLYNMFLNRLEEARVSQELEVAKRSEVFRILQSAALPLEPHSPVPWQLVLMGIVAGLALNAGIVALRMLRDTSFSGPFEVQDLLELEVIAAIPQVMSGRKKLFLRIEKVVYAVVCAGYAAAVVLFLFGGELKALLKTAQGSLM